MGNEHVIRRAFLLIAAVVAFGLACGQAAPVPATPAGGGPQSTATLPPASDAPTAEAPAPSGDGPSEQGKQLFIAKVCITCHYIESIPAARGTIGPALDGVADVSTRPKIAGDLLENTPESMKKWLADPPSIKPGTLMPKLGLSSQEIDSLVAFLQTLK